MNNSRLVYSTSGNNLCPKCEKILHKCKCDNVPSTEVNDGAIHISRETKGRKGAGVTLVSGLNATNAELKSIAKELKKKCGVGGSIKNGVIEIQGDQRNVALAFFSARGNKAKISGG